ncbi:MAG: MATE family efflux transporter [Paracoccaceae bacterium]
MAATGPGAVAPLTHGRIWRIAGPIVLSNATVPLLGAVDTGVVGQLGTAAPIGAVGLGAVILATVYWAFGFLRMGTSGLAAQAHGAGDGPESSAILLRALIVAGVAGLVLIGLQGVLVWGAFRLSPASAQVEGMARTYLTIRIWGAPATIALYAVMGWLLATERSRGMMAVQLWINGLNVVLDLWFVLGLGWGVAGVASASLIAEWSGLALGLWLCRSAFGPAFAAARARIADAAALRLMLAVNGDIMIRSVLLQLCFTAFIFLGASHGDVTLAANQVLMQFLSITAYALDGFAFAAETLVGQAVGARLAGGVRQATRLAMIWGFVGAGLLGLFFAVSGGPLIDLMTTSEAVRAEARVFLWWVVVAPLIGSAAWTWDGVFIGATLSRAMRQVMVLCVGIYVLALAVLVPAFGNHGLWAALMVLNGARSVLMTRRYPEAVAKAGAKAGATG